MNHTQNITIITQNERMRKIISKIDQIVESDGSILLIGETGVGKELFAEYIHRTSLRNNQPLVKVALSALPTDLIASELFGHEKGAFTGASVDKKGLFELANKGSIFLDDIDDFPLDLQPKLLRVLESNEIMHVGGQSSISIDTRLITASKIDLKELVDRGVFRSDLYYRINVIPIYIPPLRERREDVPLLIDYYLKRYAPNKEIKVPDEVLDAFVNYDWPGNVRELRNIIQRLALFSNSQIHLDDLPPEMRKDNTIDQILKSCSYCFNHDHMSFDQIISCLESNMLEQALEQSGGNRSQAARILQLSVSTFRDKLKKYKLEDQ